MTLLSRLKNFAVLENLQNSDCCSSLSIFLAVIPFLNGVKRWWGTAKAQRATFTFC